MMIYALLALAFVAGIIYLLFRPNKYKDDEGKMAVAAAAADAA